LGSTPDLRRVALEHLPWLMRLLAHTAPKPLLGRTMRNAHAVPGVLTDAVVDRC